jgi:hypothetical protein
MAVPFNAVLFKFFAVGPSFLHMLEASVELMFWNHVVDGQELFLNFRQTEKVKLQMHQSKEQRKIRMCGRGKGRKQKQKK